MRQRLFSSATFLGGGGGQPPNPLAMMMFSRRCALGSLYRVCLQEISPGRLHKNSLRTFLVAKCYYFRPNNIHRLALMKTRDISQHWKSLEAISSKRTILLFATRSNVANSKNVLSTIIRDIADQHLPTLDKKKRWINLSQPASLQKNPTQCS